MGTQCIFSLFSAFAKTAVTSSPDVLFLTEEKKANTWNCLGELGNFFTFLSRCDSIMGTMLIDGQQIFEHMLIPIVAIFILPRFELGIRDSNILWLKRSVNRGRSFRKDAILEWISKNVICTFANAPSFDGKIIVNQILVLYDYRFLNDLLESGIGGGRKSEGKDILWFIRAELSCANERSPNS